MIALLLAQLVIPSPSVEPLSPPGMICMGECSDGPMVWRASPARGRLVVACDMRSDTCSDGRQITTTRSTPVPCETSPGVWEMVPEDTGCYGVRGLESWAQTTSYLSYGAELDRSPWGGAATVTLDGSTYRVCAESGGAFLQQLRAEDGGVVRTAACRVRAGTSNSIRLLSADVSSGGVSFDYELTDEWQTVTATATVVEGGGIAGVRLHPARSGAGCVEVAGCWSVIGDTPGRPCWGGEAPVTCARDYHRLPATGFPATTGEISWVMSLERVPDGGEALRGIVWAHGAPVPNRLSLTRGGAIRINTGETAYVTGPLSWEPGRSYAVRLIMAEDEWRVVRDGALVGSTPPLGSMDWGATVRLGDLLDGSISSLRVRSFE